MIQINDPKNVLNSFVEQDQSRIENVKTQVNGTT